LKIGSVLTVAVVFIMAGPAAASFGSFISSLEKEPESQRQALVEKYLQSAEVPIVEGTTAWFVYRDAAASSVSVAGDFNSWKAGRDMMEKVPGTDLFYMRREFESDARLDYKFVVDGSRWILDPLNPDQVTGGFGPNSELAMPGYVQPAEIIFNPDIPHGEVIEEKFTSKILGNERGIYFYLPPGYATEETWFYPVLFVHDGGEYISLASMVIVADNLIASGEIAPLIMVFIDPVDRSGEYKAGEGFMRMIVEEIVPLADSRYRIDTRPAARGMMGASLGGLISVHMTWDNPRLFGFCASQSGAFMADYTDAVKIIEAGPPREISYYLDWGTYEPAIAAGNEDMREAILRGGHELIWKVYPEGHSWGSWRAHVDDILRAFTGRNRDADRE
jgi:enterochelin esterase family protein